MNRDECHFAAGASISTIVRGVHFVEMKAEAFGMCRIEFGCVQDVTLRLRKVANGQTSIRSQLSRPEAHRLHRLAKSALLFATDADGKKAA